MKIVGVDFSTTCPAICVADDSFSDFQFSSIINETKISGKNRNFLNEVEEKIPDIYFNQINRVQPESDAYHITERAKTVYYKALIDTLINEIKRLVAGDECIIAMEGISYGSQGSSLVDISIATGMFRYRAISDVTKSPNQFFVFSPSELKTAIGCKGNATKIDVMNRFIEMPGIEAVRQSSLYKFIDINKTHEYVLTAKGEVKSPFQDMFDSYLCVLKLYNELTK